MGSPGGGENSLFHFDETSNMSLLGDLFGDGDMGAQGGYSNISQLLNMSRPPLHSHSALNSPQGARRPPIKPAVEQNHKKRNHGEKSSEGSARPFQNIGARPANTNNPTSSTSSHYLNHNSSSAIGPSPKKQKKTGGLFAEVMAQARR